MYSIITTEGFVIDSRPYGEAGKLLYIFTRDHGLVLATAQGIRLEKSKLRYFIQDYSFGVFSFVKGKEYWRLTNAQETGNVRLETRDRSLDVGNREDKYDHVAGFGFELRAKIALLLKKMLQGEEPHPELFDVISVLDLYESRLRLHQDLVESLIVLRIFHKLGYIGNIPEINPLLASNEISEEILSIVEKNRVFINQNINKAIKESHMI